MPAFKDRQPVIHQTEHGDGVIIHWTIARQGGKILCASLKKPEKFIILKQPQTRKNYKHHGH